MHNNPFGKTAKLPGITGGPKQGLFGKPRHDTVGDFHAAKRRLVGDFHHEKSRTFAGTYPMGGGHEMMKKVVGK